ncbi:MAG: YwiC-like family protein [Bellilinea sp.]
MQAEQQLPMTTRRLFLKHVAVPNEHGSWVFLFSPLLIGLFVGGNFSWASVLFIASALSAFMLRQPVTILVKILSKRRPRSEMSVAVFWISAYIVIGLGALTGLIMMGYFSLLYLVVPALPVFGWHLWLVSRRSERRQVAVEIAGSGALALTAPAAYWIGVGDYDPVGWLLWCLTWIQAAVSIYYAYLRLEQRTWKEVPSVSLRWQAGRTEIAAATTALLLVIILSIFTIVPALLPLAYAIQWLETIYGTFKPAVKVKPTIIGLRQLFVSTLFTIVFILTWVLS